MPNRSFRNRMETWLSGPFGRGDALKIQSRNNGKVGSKSSTQNAEAGRGGAGASRRSAPAAPPLQREPCGLYEKLNPRNEPAVNLGAVCSFNLAHDLICTVGSSTRHSLKRLSARSVLARRRCSLGRFSDVTRRTGKSRCRPSGNSRYREMQPARPSMTNRVPSGNRLGRRLPRLMMRFLSRWNWNSNSGPGHQFLQTAAACADRCALLWISRPMPCFAREGAQPQRWRERPGSRGCAVTPQKSSRSDLGLYPKTEFRRSP
jgi:hypothetical protein